MSVFENLIEELKKDQLIEEGVIELNREETEKSEGDSEMAEQQNENPVLPENSSHNFSFVPEDNISNAPSAANENEFYRRRAVEEVSSLQMVEHIFSGVEREQSKVSPQAYDSIPVSKALHEFLQASKNFNSPENAVAEFKLMEETESWYTALSHRDKNILSAQLRRYCETAKPVLSAQALASLARFYRNSPYSESIRSKFDMVVTRLFSIEENDERELAFGRGEIVQHLSELYADWASISLYATDDDSKIVEIIKTFEEFIVEAEAAHNFEKLVQSDFFNRLRAYKEETGENFYAPSVAATVIACNISVGNVYVRLLKKERHQVNPENLENKYGYLLDQTISEAASKTLQLTALLEEKNAPTAGFVKTEEMATVEEYIVSAPAATYEPSPVADQRKNFLSGVFQINKWLLAATLLVILFNAGLYFWTSASEPPVSAEGVQTFQTDGYYFKDYLKTARIVNESLICIVNANWDSISQEKKQEVLKNMLAVGKENGFKVVWLQTKEGKTVDYASADSITGANSTQN